ncbi:MAG: FAD-dependent monooxygenase [Burkholderiaceae bacterium]
MQYHLNGYRGANPHQSDPAPDAGGPLPDCVDVLIVGSGPAGLTLAAQLSAFGEINTRVIERKPGPLQVGQADGIACRSMEMFEAFGIAGPILQESYWVNETSFWRPDPSAPTNITRVNRIQDVEDGLSDMPHVILNQARVHELYLDLMRHSPRRLEPHYGLTLNKLTIDEKSPYPVSVDVSPSPDNESGDENPPSKTIRAKYVVGCDGARSAVRQSLGLPLEGDSANVAWGVMDVLAVTDFPDIRLKAAIQSSASGSILIIPREGGYLVRLYIEMAQLNPGERASSRQISADQIIEKARQILHPYSLHVKELAWWSVYEIGQRLCPWFDNTAPSVAGDLNPSVFIAGDACHTHSPKAGQGMNVSMADAFNLGWKLSAVLTGQSPPSLLKTYSQERHGIARELIEFDRDMARLISSRSAAKSDQSAGEFQRYFTRHSRYTAGVEAAYSESVIVSNSQHQSLASGLKIGKRFHSAPVIRVADAKYLQLAHILKADGRWRLLAFASANDIGQPGDALAQLCDFLCESPKSPVRKHTSTNADIDSVIDFRAVFQQGHRNLALEDMPDGLQPRKGRFDLIDYEKVFCANTETDHDIFSLRGIDRDQGCVVIVRPDQFVAGILPIHDHSAMTAFFSGIFTTISAD